MHKVLAFFNCKKIAKPWYFWALDPACEGDDFKAHKHSEITSFKSAIEEAVDVDATIRSMQKQTV